MRLLNALQRQSKALSLEQPATILSWIAPLSGCSAAEQLSNKPFSSTKSFSVAPSNAFTEDLSHGRCLWSRLLTSSTAWPSQVAHFTNMLPRRYYRGAQPDYTHTMPPELRDLISSASQIKTERPNLPPLQPRQLTFQSRRSGVIAVKAGMTQEWDEYGVRVPLTVLWIDDCQVVRYKHADKDGVTSLVLGCGSKKEKQLHPCAVGEFRRWGVPLKRKLWEVKVTEDALLPPGTEIGAAHFRAGQYLDVTGVSKGKGFAGVMKRWNFKGQPASHGNTKHHRAPGSLAGRGVGRVYKRKKMPGHLGAEQVTMKNIWLYKVDPARNLLYVRGQVPGPAGSFLLVRDAFRWKWPERQAAELPFPTHLGELPPVTVASRPGPDPYRMYREDIDYFEAKWKGTD